MTLKEAILFILGSDPEEVSWPLYAIEDELKKVKSILYYCWTLRHLLSELEKDGLVISRIHVIREPNYPRGEVSHRVWELVVKRKDVHVLDDS
jgi:hypothetical protein